MMARIGSVRPRPARRGVTLILAMACLVVVAAVGMSLVRGALLQQRQSRRQYFRLQAMWLAESGVLRAAERIGREPDYSGEVWRISAEELDGSHPGVVTIRLAEAEVPMSEPGGGERGNEAATELQRQLIIEAKFPADTVNEVLQQRRLLLTPASPGGPS